MIAKCIIPCERHHDCPNVQTYSNEAPPPRNIKEYDGLVWNSALPDSFMVAQKSSGILVVKLLTLLNGFVSCQSPSAIC